jgi:hypothetical protein
MMSEFFLHYLWRFQLFVNAPLRTTKGEAIEVLNPGTSNSNGGPDFWNAHLRIGSTEWMGQVEIHVKSSDWRRHKHTNDPHYKNVILHLVHSHDEEIHLFTPGDLDVVEVKHNVSMELVEKYAAWSISPQHIRCAGEVGQVDGLIWHSWLDRLWMERMERKVSELLLLHKTTANHWPETFYRWMARGFGQRVNADAFEMLATSLPLKIVAKHRSDPFQVEALCFGQAGMLQQKRQHDYPKRLTKEYEFLKYKYGLEPVSAAAWHFSRMRPSNFPTVRIAQFADLMCRTEALFSAFLGAEVNGDLFLLMQSRAHPYWSTHYQFDGKERYASEKEVELTEEAKRQLLINVVAPALMAYGLERGEKKYIDKAEKVFELCRPEENSIIRQWIKAGKTPRHSGDTQALLELEKNYCSTLRCLECAIGLHLLKKELKT